MAGFIEPLAGEIALGGRWSAAAAGRPPERRRVGSCSSSTRCGRTSTALATVAYPLSGDGTPATDAEADARKAPGRLGIGDLADGRPAELSGGEQQRVGLHARSRAPPTSPPRRAHRPPGRGAEGHAAGGAGGGSRRPGAATLYATHDVAEAMAVADRVALLRAGRIVQVGTPAEVYQRPIDRWAAQLTGPASVLAARVVEHSGRDGMIEIGGATVRVDLSRRPRPAHPTRACWCDPTGRAWGTVTCRRAWPD